jgi:uncharacterized membrane protein (UPF0182 family)
LTTTFTPNGRDNLSAFMAVDSEAGTKDYGRIRILQLTSSTADGPKQVQSQFNSNSQENITEFIRQVRNGDSEIEYGNLLTVPLDEGLLYVEPVYVRGGGLKLPLLRKVLMTYGGRTAFENTLDEALNKLFPTGDSTTPPPDSDQDTTTPPPTDNPTVKEALGDAQKAFTAGQDALKKGDWEAYGKAQKDLQDALKRAEDAQAAAGRTDSGDGKSSAGKNGDSKNGDSKDGDKSSDKSAGSADG